MPVRRQRLAQGEEVLRPVIAHERFGDGLPRRLDAVIAVPRKHGGVPLPGEKSVEDGEAGDPGDVAEDMVELEVHLGEGFLDVLGVTCRHLDQAVAMAQEGPHGTHRLRRAEGGAEQADGVEILEPLAVLDIGFPSRDVLDMPRVDQADLQAARL